jgi:hypothetical protein
MSPSPEIPTPSNSDLKNPLFIAWLADQLRDDTLEPDVQDYERPHVQATKEKETANLYRLAISRKLLRMYATWKASQN